MEARKKPVVIEYYPCEEKYLDKIMEWSTEERPIEQDDILEEEVGTNQLRLKITTLEGVHEASNKDIIIKGVKDEIYPCKKDIFEATYDTDKKEFYPPEDTVLEMKVGDTVGFNCEGKHWTITRDK